MTNPLTERQRQVFDFICRWRDERGGSPTLSEIAGAFDVAPSTVHRLLERIERKGYIARGIVILVDAHGQKIADCPSAITLLP